MTASPPSPRPRRIAAPRWLDLRLVLGVVLVLGAVLVGAAVVADARHTYPVVAARHDLAAGVIVTPDDLGLARVQLPDHGAHVYLTDARSAVGKQLNRPVSAGELVPAAALDRVAAQTTITVPLAAAAAPDLRKGERIELWVSTSRCASTVLLPDVAVQSVHADSGGSFSSGGGGQDVVISVPPARADRVITALAFDQVQLRAGVLVGSAAASAAAVLPDLTGCASTSTGR